MFFAKKMIVAIAAMGLTTFAFAADDVATVPAPADATTAQVTDATTTTTTSTTETAAVVDQAKVDINKATAKDLMKVKGLNAAKAKAIIAYRKKQGDFKSVDDLKNVKGFKKLDEQALQAIESQLTVG